MAVSLWPRCFDPPCSRSQGQPGRKVSRKHSPDGVSTRSGLSLSMVMIQRRVSHLSQTDPRDAPRHVRRVVHTGGRSVWSTDQGRTELTTLATVGVYFSDTWIHFQRNAGQVIAPGAARRYAPAADGSSTRGGSTSVRGRVRSPHISGGRRGG